MAPVALVAKPEPVQNIERAMQVECPRDADGNPVGSYQYRRGRQSRPWAARILRMLVDPSGPEEPITLLNVATENQMIK